MNGLKKYLLAVAATLTVQTGVVIWWASALTTRVGYLDREVVKVGDRLADHVDGHRP